VVFEGVLARREVPFMVCRGCGEKINQWDYYYLKRGSGHFATGGKHCMTCAVALGAKQPTKTGVVRV